MRVIWMWVVPLIVVAGVVVGVSYFQGGMFHHTPGSAPAQQETWVAVPHPPGDRVEPHVPVIKEFGSWHLACFNREAAPAPKVGYIQNLGIVSGEGHAGKPDRCHVFIVMRNPAAAGQRMVMNFRYLNGFDVPELAVIYSAPGDAHVIYDQSGQVHDMTQKGKWHGGFYRDLKKAPIPDQLKVQHQEVPVVRVAVGGTNVSIKTAICIHGRCIAHENSAKIDGVSPGTRIVVGLPSLTHGSSQQVEVPSDGLGAALAELARQRSS